MGSGFWVGWSKSLKGFAQQALGPTEGEGVMGKVGLLGTVERK